MKLIILLAFVALVAARPDDDYSRYENINVDEITSNERLLKAYCDCFLDIGKCTSEGSGIKELIPGSIQDNCSKCSEHQKNLVAKFILTIQEQLPENWDKLNKLYNPDGKYDANVKDFLQKYGH